MNIILFEPTELAEPLARSDPRARHILEVLRRGPGDEFDAGVVNGRRGKARVQDISPAGVSLSFMWSEEPPPLAPITLLIGMCRPQTARKILFEATTLGVSAMHFVRTDKSEPNYARSHLWSTGEWRRHLVDGAQQAFCTRLPAVSWESTLGGTVAALPPHGCRLALDNYEAAGHLAAARVVAPVTLAIGPERGWSEADRDLLRRANFTFVHLGERVLRAETAAVAAVSLALALVEPAP